MAIVAFLRGANLGSKRFSPKAVEADLEDLDVTSLGAAGTFVVRKAVPVAELRRRLAAALPFEPEVMVLRAPEVVRALEAGESVKTPPGAKRFATILATKPSIPSLPLEEPEGDWGVRVLAVSGKVALGVRRRVDARGVYPNEVVERAFKVRSTTRDWPTMEKVAAALQS